MIREHALCLIGLYCQRDHRASLTMFPVSAFIIVAWNPVRTRHFTAEDTAAADLYTAFAVIVASNGSIMVGRLLVYVFIDDLVVFDVLYFTAVCFISVTILTSVASACLHHLTLSNMSLMNWMSRIIRVRLPIFFKPIRFFVVRVSQQATDRRSRIKF